MAHFRVFDTETANQLLPRLSQADTVDISSAGEYFSADAGEVILAPSVKSGDVLYIKIRSFVAPPAPVRNVPQSTAKPPDEIERNPASPAPVPPPTPKTSKHYVASGFLGLDGDVEEEVPEAPKPWWKRLID